MIPKPIIEYKNFEKKKKEKEELLKQKLHQEGNENCELSPDVVKLNPEKIAKDIDPVELVEPVDSENNVDKANDDNKNANNVKLKIN
jgi:hypothetical protein